MFFAVGLEPAEVRPKNLLALRIMNVVLIGYRGTGKTTVARPLSLRLGWDWVDADVEIEIRAGRSIAAIFADLGEPAFRDLESAVLADLVERPNLVVLDVVAYLPTKTPARF